MTPITPLRLTLIFGNLCESEDLKCVNLVPAEKREKPTLIDG